MHGEVIPEHVDIIEGCEEKVNVTSDRCDPPIALVPRVPGAGARGTTRAPVIRRESETLPVVPDPLARRPDYAPCIAGMEGRIGRAATGY